MKSVLVQLALVALFLFVAVQAAHPGSKYVADLETSQEVPPVIITNGTTNGTTVIVPTGVAVFHIDLSTNVLNWTITHTVANPTGAHIHAPAPRGSTAPPVITLTTASPIVGNATLTAEQLGWLQNGTMYINVHNADHPDGVIRGQIEVAPNEYEAVLNAQGVVPPSASNHTGTGVFTYNPSTKVLTWNIVHDVVDPTDAAIHGPAGDSDNAPSILSLGTTSPIKGQSTITDDNAKALENGELYVQINTAQHPSGDIRGHITRTGDDNSGLSGGVIALIVILVITAVVAVVAGALIVYKKRQKRKFEVVGSQSGDYVPPNF